jgi:hypothetical protein
MSQDSAPSAAFRIPPISELPLTESELRLFTNWTVIPTPARGPQVKGSWSPDEDKVLLHAISGCSNISWDEVAARIPNHTAKQCRERWLVKLNPDVRRSPFEKWEDELIRSERHRIGNHWSIIAQLLPGRTACSVKNRWYTVLRYQYTPLFLIPDPHFCPMTQVIVAFGPKVAGPGFV